MNPVTLMAPYFFYMMVFQPCLIVLNDYHVPLFGDMDALIETAIMYLVGVSAFNFGIFRGLSLKGREKDLPRFVISPAVRRSLQIGAFFFSGIGYISFFAGIITVGGFQAAYGQAYGGGRTEYGYLNTAILLLFTGASMYMLSREGGKMRIVDYFVVLLLVFPQALHSILGARRGPFARVLLALGFGPFTVSPRRVSFWFVMAVLAVVGLGALFLVSQRGAIFLGSLKSFEKERFISAIYSAHKEPDTGMLADAGIVTMSTTYNRHYWGRRLVPYMLVRIIPKQLWPTKYEDIGFGYLASAKTYSDASFEPSLWNQTLGWRPSRGAPPTYFADLFLEFWWFGPLVGGFLTGYFVGFLWRKAMRTGGIWSVINFQSMMSYIFMTTQSVEAYWALFLFGILFAIPYWFVFVQPFGAREWPEHIQRMLIARKIMMLRQHGRLK